LESSHSVLDVGCGTGKHLFQIAKMVEKVVGLDISDESLAKCNQKITDENLSHVTVHKCDLAEIKETVSDSFDRILSSFAIYYTEDKEKTFGDCFSLLKEGGLLLVCGPGLETNAEFRDLVKKAGGDFSEDFMKWSHFLENEAKPLLEKLFGNVEVVVFENPIEFPDEDTLFKYWQATSLYDAAIEEEMKKVIAEAFKEGKFINKKIIYGLKCRK